GADCSLNAPGDLINQQPLLGALTNNGGPTQTQALLSGSPAINAGSNCGVATDQRGLSRNQGPACDIGAYELRAGLTPWLQASVALTSVPAVWAQGQAQDATVTLTNTGVERWRVTGPAALTLDVFFLVGGGPGAASPHWVRQGALTPTLPNDVLP